MVTNTGWHHRPDHDEDGHAEHAGQRVNMGVIEVQETQKAPLPWSVKTGPGKQESPSRRGGAGFVLVAVLVAVHGGPDASSAVRGASRHS